MSWESSCRKFLHVRKQTRLPPSGLIWLEWHSEQTAAPASPTPSIDHKSFSLVPMKTRDRFRPRHRKRHSSRLSRECIMELIGQGD